MKLKTNYKNLTFDFIKSRSWEGDHVVIYDQEWPVSHSLPLRTLKGAVDINTDFIINDGGKDYVLTKNTMKELLDEISLAS